MKTLGRILIILTVFALVMGLMYAAVNAAGSILTGSPRFENDERPSPADGQFQPGQRPEGFEERERDEGGSLFGLIGGFVKNIVIISVVVVLIAVPRSLMRNRKRVAPVATE